MSKTFDSASSIAPCLNCGKKRRCSRSTDGQVQICYFKAINGGVEAKDKNGDRFWKKVTHAGIPQKEVGPLIECASDKDCSRAYTEMLDILNLDVSHRQAMRDRGLSDVDIERAQYRSMPQKGRADLFKKLEQKFGRDLLKQIPGITAKGNRWSVGGAAGTLIPVRNIEGEVIRLLIRPDQVAEAKYLWLSSAKHGGPTSGIRIHIPCFNRQFDEIRFTEGIVKADVATALSGTLTIGIPGVGNWQQAVELAQLIQPKIVRLAFDADAAENENVARALLNFFDALKSKGINTVYEHWDGALAKGVDDAFQGGIAIHTEATDTARDFITALPALNANRTTDSNEPQRPQIRFGLCQMRDLINVTWKTMQDANSHDPVLYAQARRLVRLVDNEKHLEIKELDQVEIWGHLVRIADWFEEYQKFANDTLTTFERVSTPPKDLAKDLLAYVSDEIPKLDGVIETPLFGQAGDLILAPGYNKDNALFMDPKRMLKTKEVSAAPSADEVKRAISFLKEQVFSDFPLAVYKIDIAHILAALVTGCMREMIQGPTPLFLFNAPSPGSGKNLLADLISLILTGTLAEARPVPGREEEMRKMITAELIRAPRIILLDNADQDAPRLHSPSLAAVLTSTVWTDRFLSQSRMVSLPNRALWMLTGNNVRLTSELSRRTITIGLEPGIGNPWERDASKFKHPNLREWVGENRALLLHAVLTICQSWISQGTAYGTKSLGSFESWAKIVGGVLEHAGISEFLETSRPLDNVADIETADWLDFVAAWWDEFGTSSKKASDLFYLCGRHELLGSVLTSGTEHARQTKLGIELANKQERIFGSFRIKMIKNAGKHGKFYALMPTNLHMSSESPHVKSQSKLDSLGTSGEVGDLKRLELNGDRK